MELQDLKNNRDRIIKTIKNQSSAKEAVSCVMSKMLAWIERSDVKEMKPTMANIDKLTIKVTQSWIKNNWVPTYTKDENDAWLEAKKLDSLPSSLR